jgi:hypothetical protein
MFPERWMPYGIVDQMHVVCTAIRSVGSRLGMSGFQSSIPPLSQINHFGLLAVDM